MREKILIIPFTADISFKERACAQDISRAISSFSDRVFNFFVDKGREGFSDCSFIVSKFENQLANILKSLLKTCTNNDEWHFLILSLIMVDYLTVNVEFVECFFNELLDEGTDVHIFPNILFYKHLDPKSRERLILALFGWTKNCSVIDNIWIKPC